MISDKEFSHQSNKFIVMWQIHSEMRERVIKEEDLIKFNLSNRNVQNRKNPPSPNIRTKWNSVHSIFHHFLFLAYVTVGSPTNLHKRFCQSCLHFRQNKITDDVLGSSLVSPKSVAAEKLLNYGTNFIPNRKCHKMEKIDFAVVVRKCWQPKY